MNWCRFIGHNFRKLVHPEFFGGWHLYYPCTRCGKVPEEFIYDVKSKFFDFMGTILNRSLM